MVEGVGMGVGLGVVVAELETAVVIGSEPTYVVDVAEEGGGRAHVVQVVQAHQG